MFLKNRDLLCPMSALLISSVRVSFEAGLPSLRWFICRPWGYALDPQPREFLFGGRFLSCYHHICLLGYLNAGGTPFTANNTNSQRNDRFHLETFQ